MLYTSCGVCEPLYRVKGQLDDVHPLQRTSFFESSLIGWERSLTICLARARSFFGLSRLGGSSSSSSYTHQMVFVLLIIHLSDT